MQLRKRSFGIVFLLGMTLAGCETTNPHETLMVSTPVSSLKKNKTLQPQVAQAFVLLKEGKYSEASTFINQTLQSQPKNVALHILNAITYEKLAEQGDVTGLDLATVGYQNALNMDPFNSFAITQLGKLKYREQQFDQAQEHFANALLIKPNDPDLMHEFAAASYYAYDIKSALAAIQKAEKLKPDDPLIQRSAAMMYAAVGDFKTAEKHFNLFQAKVGPDPEVSHVANRFNDWQSLYQSGRIHLAADKKSSKDSSVGSESSGSKNPKTVETTTTTITTTKTTTDSANQDSTGQDSTGQDAGPSAATAKDSGAKDTGVKDTSSKDAVSSDSTSKDSGAKDTGGQDTSSKGAGTTGTVSKDTSSKDTGSSDTTSKDAGTPDTGAKDTSSKDAASSDSTSKTSGTPDTSTSGSKGASGGASDTTGKDSGGGGGLTIDEPFPSESETPTKEEFSRADIGQNILDVPVASSLPKGQEAPASPQIIVDCYILQITERAGSTKGHNILDALSVTLNPGSWMKFKGSLWGRGVALTSDNNRDSLSYNPDSGFATALDVNGKLVNTFNPATTQVNLNSMGSMTGRIFTSGLTWAGLTYSLNIANAFDQRTEIVSRPTLMTYLRKESKFFSGIELVNVSGGTYGSNLSRYPVGVGLAIMPESLNGDLLTLSLSIESSLLQNVDPNLLLTVDVTKTRVDTTARIRLGETILLGGIYERTEVSGKQGFPGLRDIPIVEYFFAQEQTASVRTSIAILLTPRSPDTVKSAVNRAMTRESLSPHLCELVSRNPDWFNPEVNAVNIFSYFNLDPVLYYEFRTGDILPPSWAYEVALSDKLGELESFIYF